MYYAAILCPPQVDEKILRFKHWMRDRFGCVAALKSPAHLTLVPPFWLEETREADLLQTLGRFTCDIGEIEIRLEGYSHFNRQVLFVNVKANPSIEELKNQAEDHFIQSFGDIIKKDTRPFHPHVTIATRDLKPGDFEKAWDHFAKKEFNESFSAATISLLKLDHERWSPAGQINW